MAKALIKRIDPIIAKLYAEKLVKKGVQGNQAYDRTALAWKAIEEGVNGLKKK
ncbi:hypothetical protein TWF730_010092 [Orbilia blumenaviensis]|uniref:Uncharacterized protein n=1 Tax=Orbilia blumenaviensis TaxID=1796055 RepID=A0AAV9UUN6_9PEZI